MRMLLKPPVPDLGTILEQGFRHLNPSTKPCKNRPTSVKSSRKMSHMTTAGMQDLKRGTLQWQGLNRKRDVHQDLAKI